MAHRLAVVRAVPPRAAAPGGGCARTRSICPPGWPRRRWRWGLAADYIVFYNSSRWIKDVPRYARQLRPRDHYELDGLVQGYVLLRRV
ncbi:hypothetical protein [Streptomyces sp. MA5143a]|uniref:hypothetical protein n=1 Tax=Streptomyces sp. MA5143a TaxID=2083010 RepID=UPI000D1BADD9|nr:hypothetical protein [Streptomyces sp. MA5143a]